MKIKRSDQNTGYLYRHIRLDTNQVFYVGISTNNDNRFRRAYEKRGRSQFWKNITNKTDYDVEIVMSGLTPSQLDTKEKEFISLYGKISDKKGTLVNFLDGGVAVPYIRKSMSEEHRLSMVGRKLPQETRDKISKANKGRKLSPEQVQFLKNRGMGHITPKTRKVQQLTLDGELIKVWNSIQECCNELGTMHSMVVHCCRGRKKTHKGYKWAYHE